MKDRFILLILIFTSSSLFAGPLPFTAGVNSKSMNADTLSAVISSENWLESAQTHAGRDIFTFDHNNSSLYLYYLEKYSSPAQINWLQSVMERADIYIDFIDDVIHRNDMPHELLYLPVTESAYRYNAVSRSGAVGLWQFMRNSISPYSMKIDDWADDRRDFWKSTEGAIAKLKYNHDILGGDWLLALAAYNCGLGRVQRTIKATGISDYWELSRKGLLPSETIHYVPRFLAISAILSGRGRYGIGTSWREPYKWERVRLDNSVSLSKLASEAGLPYDLVKSANAELRYDITPSRHDYYLKVPEGMGKAVTEAISLSKDNLMKFHFYQIKKGDTLYDLGRHYGVSVSMIQSYNKHLDPSYLSIGQKILVPALKDVPPYKGKQASPAEMELDNPANYNGSHIVRSGDTLWSIARRYGTNPYNVAYHNGILLDSLLTIGMELRVPDADS
ncbi:MAG: transglycosylase SLT domain-containing protein [Spirochaetia bacterium]|jgi:membrane-bound lytic murein transglycosylase D|nr:transglycosylase SLT domain-containing protein [Spirochaetia bacterium]